MEQDNPLLVVVVVALRVGFHCSNFSVDEAISAGGMLRIPNYYHFGSGLFSIFYYHAYP